MKNLKRVLSLALTGVMLVGMMAIGASAADTKDFTDKDEIQHTEAVNVMSTLGVLKGKDTGAFDPTATVTRAEMAKIITVMRNGGVDPTLGSSSAQLYTDVPATHWARGYIEYCSNLGIIAGQGDGTFNPEGPVTGAAAAKMLLVAMDYDPEIFGYTGPDWELSVNRDANESKLYDEIKSIDTSAGLSRDNVAQMAYNALDAFVMTRGYDKVVNSGEISYNYNKSTTTTFLNKYFNAYTFVGNFTGNYNTHATNIKGQIAVYGRLDTESATGDNAVQARTARFPYDFSIMNIGEEVKVIFKDGKAGTDNTPDKNDEIFGVFLTGRTDVVWGTRGTVDNQKSPKAQISIDGVKYDTVDKDNDKKDLTVTVYTNYITGTGDAKHYLANNGVEEDKKKDIKGVNSDLTKALQGDNGDVIKAITNPETGLIDTIYVTEYEIGAVTAVNSEKITVSGVGAITFEGNEIYEGVKRGDIVVTTTWYEDDITDDNAYTIVEKAEVVSGTVNRYKTTYKEDGKTVDSYDNVKLDDTTYTIHNCALMLNNIPDETATTAFDDEDLGEAFDLYLINGYVGAAIQTSESASNYSLVTAVKSEGQSGSVFKALQLQVMDSEGTKTIITVNDDSKALDGKTKATSASDYSVGDIVVWSGSASDAKVTIKGKVQTGAASYDDSTKAFNGAVTTAGCVLFAETTTENSLTAPAKDQPVHDLELEPSDGKTAAKFKAYGVRSLRDTGVEAGGFYTQVKNNDGKVVAIFLDLTGTPGGATDKTVYGIVKSWTGRGTASDGVAYDTFEVVNDQESYTINIDSQLAIKKGQLVSFEPTSDEIYTDEFLNVWDTAEDESGKTPNKTHDNVTVESVFVKEYSPEDNTLTWYNTLTGDSKKGYEGNKGDQGTMALDKECRIVYVNADGDKAGSDIGIDRFDSVTGWANAAVLWKTDGKDKVIVAIYVETSNKCDILYTEGRPADPVVPDADASTTPVANAKAAKVTLSGGKATLEVEVTAPADTKTVTYAWAGPDGKTIAGAEAATYEASAAGKYTCTVTNTEAGKKPATCKVEFTVEEPETVTLGTVPTVTSAQGGAYTLAYSKNAPVVGEEFTVSVTVTTNPAAEETIKISYNGTTKNVTVGTDGTLSGDTATFTAAKGVAEVTASI